MLALPPPYHGGKKLDPGACRQAADMIHHLIHGLFFYFLPAFRTVGDTDTRIQKPEIIIDFRHGTYRGTGSPVCGFLIDGNSRRQAFYFFHIRLFHLSQELSGVGRQRLHIPALSLRIYCVKGKGRFPGAGQPREDHQFISGNIHINPFQVMLICPTDFDIFTGLHLYAFLFHVVITSPFKAAVSYALFHPVTLLFSPAFSSVPPSCHEALPPLRSSDPKLPFSSSSGCRR